MSADITSNDPDAEIVLLPSSGGVFEVVKDGKLVFSKKELGRFPNAGEVI